jgi:GxxExxY protein
MTRMNADRSDILISKDLTERVIGAFYDVYNELGYGFIESVYEEALTRTLDAAGMRYTRQCPVPVYFRGERIADFRLDLVVEQQVIVEIKAVSQLTPVIETQLVNYLKATGFRVGLLLNFGPRAEVRRRVFDTLRRHPRPSAKSASEKGS